MSIRPTLRQSLVIAALTFGCGLVSMPITEASAQQRNTGPDARQLNYTYTVPQRGVGGYSLRLRDIWGPAEMPPAPKDFGPHYDYPPESLNAGPTKAPYLN